MSFADFIETSLPCLRSISSAADFLQTLQVQSCSSLSSPGHSFCLLIEPIGVKFDLSLGPIGPKLSLKLKPADPNLLCQ